MAGVLRYTVLEGGDSVSGTIVHGFPYFIGGRYYLLEYILPAGDSGFIDCILKVGVRSEFWLYSYSVVRMYRCWGCGIDDGDWGFVFRDILRDELGLEVYYAFMYVVKYSRYLVLLTRHGLGILIRMLEARRGSHYSSSLSFSLNVVGEDRFRLEFYSARAGAGFNLELRLDELKALEYSLKILYNHPHLMSRGI